MESPRAARERLARFIAASVAEDMPDPEARERLRVTVELTIGRQQFDAMLAMLVNLTEASSLIRNGPTYGDQIKGIEALLNEYTEREQQAAAEARGWNVGGGDE